MNVRLIHKVANPTIHSLQLINCEQKMLPVSRIIDLQCSLYNVERLLQYIKPSTFSWGHQYENAMIFWSELVRIWGEELILMNLVGTDEL